MEKFFERKTIAKHCNSCKKPLVIFRDSLHMFRNSKLRYAIPFGNIGG